MSKIWKWISAGGKDQTVRTNCVVIFRGLYGPNKDIIIVVLMTYETLWSWWRQRWKVRDSSSRSLHNMILDRKGHTISFCSMSAWVEVKYQCPRKSLPETKLIPKRCEKCLVFQTLTRSNRTIVLDSCRISRFSNDDDEPILSICFQFKERESTCQVEIIDVDCQIRLVT